MDTTTPLDSALAQFDPVTSTIAQMKEDFSGLSIDGMDDKDGLAQVHGARMIVKTHRVAVEKTRKNLKRDALEFGRSVDREAKRITEMLLEIEQPLHEQEKVVENEKARVRAEEADRLRKKTRDRVDRLNKLKAFEHTSLSPLDVGTMTDEVFEETLRSAAHTYEVEQKRAEEVAAEAAAREATLQAEREAAAEQLEEERKELEAQKAAQEEETRKLARERQEIEHERAKVAAEAKAEEDRKAREAAEKAAAERLEKLRPENERIMLFGQGLRSWAGEAMPSCRHTKVIEAIVHDAVGQILTLATTP